MITHHCGDCGTEVDSEAYCTTHPAAEIVLLADPSARFYIEMFGVEGWTPLIAAVVADVPRAVNGLTRERADMLNAALEAQRAALGFAGDLFGETRVAEQPRAFVDDAIGWNVDACDDDHDSA